MTKNNTHISKHLKIKSKARFASFIIVLLIFISTLTIGAFKVFSEVGYAETTYQKIEVVAGDTLWSIARDYKSENSDIRDAVSKISGINELKGTNLKVGQVLLVPSDL